MCPWDRHLRWITRARCKNKVVLEESFESNCEIFSLKVMQSEQVWSHRSFRGASCHCWKNTKLACLNFHQSFHTSVQRSKVKACGRMPHYSLSSGMERSRCETGDAATPLIGAAALCVMQPALYANILLFINGGMFVLSFFNVAQIVLGCKRKR